MRAAVLALLLLFGAAPLRAECAGDCHGDGAVTVDELLALVGCALSPLPVERTCTACPALTDGEPLSINYLIAAVNHALTGCPSFRLTVLVGERPHQTGYSRGGTVTLHPLGLTAGPCCLPGPEFVFEAVPPGDYTLTYGATCNPFGCFERHVPVRVVDGDAAAFIPIRPACRSDADCDGGARCVPPGGHPGCGICRDDADQCATDDDCATDHRCLPAAEPPCPCDGTPALLCTPRCAADGDCADGEHCLDGRCLRAACDGDADCPPFAACVRGACYDTPGRCTLPPP